MLVAGEASHTANPTNVVVASQGLGSKGGRGGPGPLTEDRQKPEPRSSEGAKGETGRVLKQDQ